jgi:hypothetical protein
VFEEQDTDFAHSCTWDDKHERLSALKMADVVCAQNFFRRKGTKPILQVTVEGELGVASFLVNYF